MKTWEEMMKDAERRMKEASEMVQRGVRGIAGSFLAGSQASKKQQPQSFSGVQPHPKKGCGC